MPGVLTRQLHYGNIRSLFALQDIPFIEMQTTVQTEQAMISVSEIVGLGYLSVTTECVLAPSVGQ